MPSKHLLALGVVALFAMSLPMAALDISSSVEAAASSRYVFRGVKLGAAGFQPAATLNVGPVDFGFWANHPFAADESIERDYTVGYSRSLFGIDWRTTAQAYTYPQATAPATEETYEFGLTGSRQVWGDDNRSVSCSLTTFYDVRLDALTFEAALTHERKVLPWLGLSVGGTVGHSAAYNLTPDAEPPKTRDAYTYMGAKAEARVSLGAKGYLRTGVSWDTTKGLNGGELDLGGNTVVWAALGCEW